MVLAQKQKSQSILLTDILVIVGLLWFDSGIVSNLPYFSGGISIMLFIGSFVLIAISKSDFIGRWLRSGAGWGLLFLLTITFSNLLLNNELPTESYDIIYAVMLLTYFVYLQKRPLNIIKFVVFFVLLERIVIGINTIVVLTVNPDVSRLLATGDSAGLEGVNTFMVAGFHFVYSTVIFLAAIFMQLKNIKDFPIIERIIILVYVVVSVLLIFRALYTAALLVMLFMFGLALISRRKKNVITTLLVVALLAVVCFSLVPFLDYLASTLFQNTVVADRLNEVINLLQGDANGASDFASRLNSTKVSLGEFLQSPLFGIYEKTDNVYDVLGMHAEWFDLLALFGVLRCLILVAFLSKAYQYFASFLQDKTSIRLAFVCFIILGFLNPISSSGVYLVLLALVPLFCIVQEENHKRLLSGENGLH